MRAHKYAIGTVYRSRGKRGDLCTVVDRLTTRNEAGDVVKLCYISSHEFAGQSVLNRDVCEVTIARGLVE